MAIPSGSGSGEKPIKEEIVDLANLVTKLQTRLGRLCQRVDAGDQDSDAWRIRYLELEERHMEAVNSAKWLRAQNAELERQVDEHKPVLTNAISAREGAFNKLKHARKVIRDLLSERADMAFSNGGSGESIQQEDIERALYDEFYRDEESPSTDSDKTVQLAASVKASPRELPSPSLGQHSPQMAQALSPTLSSTSTRESRRNTPTGTYTSDQSTSDSEVLSPLSESTAARRVEMHPLESQFVIHFKKPPGSSQVREGPYSWLKLQRSLDLSDEMMNALQGLGSSSKLSMRLQMVPLPTQQMVVCCYDPIMVETQRKTYLVDWGHWSSNQGIERYVEQHKEINPIFHMFTFPVKENNWYYIGAHVLSVSPLETLWPLEKRSRTKLLKKLCERSQGKVGEVEMARLLDSGEAVQMCFELTPAADPQITYTFSRTALRSPPRT